MQLIPEIGLVAGTRDTRFFVAEPADLETLRELLGPNGERPAPTRAWFQKIRPLSEGFIASLDGPHSFLQYAPSWGYCPQQLFENEDVSLSRFDVIGGRILAGGGNRAATAPDGPVKLPVFEWE